jgi:hypothetical protein
VIKQSKLLTLGLSLAVVLATSGAAFAGDANRSFQRSKQALLSVGPAGEACKPGLFGLIPNIDIDLADACSNIPNTYLYKKTVVTADGSTTKIKEVKELRDSYLETASIDSEGTESLSVKITSGRSADTNLGVSRNLTISDLTGIFGSADTASRLSRTMAHGLAAARRSHQDPVAAPTQ